MYFIIVERLTIAILRCFIFGQISMCLENLRILWTFNTLWRSCWHSDLKMNWTRNNCNNHNNRCLLCCAFITFTKNRFNSTRKENRNFHHVLQNCCKKRWLMYCQIQLSKFAFIHDCKPRIKNWLGTLLYGFKIKWRLFAAAYIKKRLIIVKVRYFVQLLDMVCNYALAN